MNWDERVEQMRQDFKSLAKQALDSDDTDVAEIALKAHNAICDARNYLQRWHAHEWEYVDQRASLETADNQNKSDIQP